MKKHGKKYVEASKKVDSTKLYSVDEAISLVKETSVTKFDSTVEVAIKLNIDAKKSDQNLRGSFVLPNGTGKKKKILVIAKGEAQAKAREAERQATKEQKREAKMQKNELKLQKNQLKIQKHQLKNRNKIKCPKCRSTNVQPLGVHKKGFSVGKAVGGTILVGGVGSLAGFAGKSSKKTDFVCMNCGKQFKK